MSQASVGSLTVRGTPASPHQPAMLPATLTVRPAAPSDEPRVVEVIAQAFLHDPTWAWAFPDPAARRQWWQICTHEALRYPWVLCTQDFEAVSVWIPPEGSEFSQEAEARLATDLQRLVGSRAPDVTELLSRFGNTHPRQAPHFYLSLLATADAHRGRGIGLALLKENLARIDAQSTPAYLESSNPQNNPRYQALGFTAVGSFHAPGNGPVVTGMWRAAVASVGERAG